jgi:hypothetical protein
MLRLEALVLSSSWRPPPRSTDYFDRSGAHVLSLVESRIHK